MTPQPQQDRCVLTRHDVQSIKDLVFIVGGNSESSAQKAIFEILANNMRRSRPAPAPTLTNDKCGSEKCMAIINAHREEAAAKEREKVLDDLREWFIKNKCNGCPYGRNLLDKIKSLRGDP